MKVLVTGGLGFIGSHTAVELLDRGFEVVIVDDCSNASEEVLEGIETITGKRPVFEKLDLRIKEGVASLFARHNDIGGIIHFAASKAVGESVEKPLLYYENNIHSLIYLLKHMAESGGAFIFSSSCSCAQVEHLVILLLLILKETFQGNDMGLGQVDHMDIIPDACTIPGWIIISKHLQFVTQSCSGLSDKWNQVLRYSHWQFTNFSAGMGSYRVEIAQ